MTINRFLLYKKVKLQKESATQAGKTWKATRSQLTRRVVTWLGGARGLPCDNWTGSIPLQATGTWLPHTSMQLWSAVGDSRTHGSRLLTPSLSVVKPVSSSCHH